MKNNKNKYKNIISFVPLITYTNIELQKILILNDNKNKSGIYKWVNILTGDFYYLFISIKKWL